jgi:hypothetical protein
VSIVGYGVPPIVTISNSRTPKDHLQKCTPDYNIRMDNYPLYEENPTDEGLYIQSEEVQID